MTSEQFTATGGQTIFPRINFLKTFTARANQRALNGRIFGPYGVKGIDDEGRYPASDGSDCLAGNLPFPIDLGPAVATTPTALFDLRNDCGTPTTYNLNPLN